jgi:hypothetical protein
MGFLRFCGIFRKIFRNCGFFRFWPIFLQLLIFPGVFAKKINLLKILRHSKNFFNFPKFSNFPNICSFPADNGGFRAAFRAYKHFLETNTDSQIPGYRNYTNEQIFFISTGVVSITFAYLNFDVLTLYF